MDETKPCVICDKQLKPVMPDKNNPWNTYQPYGGGEIQLIFSFGSLKFDENSGSTVFRGIICDDCAEKLVNKMDKKGYKL